MVWYGMHDMEERGRRDGFLLVPVVLWSFDGVEV